MHTDHVTTFFISFVDDRNKQTYCIAYPTITNSQPTPDLKGPAEIKEEYAAGD